MVAVSDFSGLVISAWALPAPPQRCQWFHWSDDEVPDKSSGSASPRFSRQRRSRVASSHDDPGIGAANETMPFNVIYGDFLTLRPPSVSLAFKLNSTRRVLRIDDPKRIIPGDPKRIKFA